MNFSSGLSAASFAWFSARLWSVMTISAPESARMKATSSGLRKLLITVTTPPARHTPNKAHGNSGQFFSHTATRCPRRTPWSFASVRDTHAARCASQS